MPQVIKSGGGSGQPPKKSGKSGDGLKFSGDISELPKPLLIGVGVLVLIFLVFMVDRFIIPVRPKSGPGYEKVAPPPGYPDEYPYNDKAWQKAGKPPMSGMPPMEALQKMKGGQ